MVVTVPLDRARLGQSDQGVWTPWQVDSARPLPFPLRSTAIVRTAMPGLAQGKHEIQVVFVARPSGQLHREVEDSTARGHDARTVAARGVA